MSFRPVVTPLTLELRGEWGKRAPVVTVGGDRVAAELKRDVLVVSLPAGVSDVRLTAAG